MPPRPDGRSSPPLARHNSQEQLAGLFGDTAHPIGPGPYQLIVLCFAGGIYASEGSLLLIVSITAKYIVHSWELPLPQITAGVIAAHIFIGLVVGTFVGGTTCDKYGRRVPILITYVGIIVFVALCVISPNLLPLLLAKLMLGFFLGLGLPPANAMVAESCPPTHRVTLYSMTMVFFSLGQVYSACALWFLNPDLKADEANWRAMLATAMIPPIICLIGAYFFLLESPHWLLAQERYDEAKEVVIKMAKYNSGDDVSRSGVTFAIQFIDSARHHREEPEGGQLDRQSSMSEATSLVDKEGGVVGWTWYVRVLFTPKWRRLTLIMCYITFVSNFSYFGMVYGLPHSLKDMPVGGDLSPAGAVFISALFEIPGVFLAMLLGNTVTRRTNVFINFSATAVFLWGTIYSLYAGRMSSVGLLCTFAVKMCISSGFIICYLYLLECYPTRFRATGLAFCMVVGRIGAFFCPFIHDALIFFNQSTIYFFILMDIVLWVGTTLSCFLPMETKNAPLMTEPTGSEFKGSDFSGCD